MNFVYFSEFGLAHVGIGSRSRRYTEWYICRDELHRNHLKKRTSVIHILRICLRLSKCDQAVYQVVRKRGENSLQFRARISNSIIFSQNPIFRLVKMWFGGEPIALPKWDALPYETRDICDQFVRQHLQKCKVDIERTK